MRLAVITDLHFSGVADSDNPRRIGKYGDVFLLRAVRRLNRYIRPDCVFLAGDLVDGDFDPERLEKLRDIAGQLNCPCIAIPGNHDPDAGIFYEVFARPPDFLDIGGVRLLPFIDAAAPGYNAERSPADLERMRALAEGFSGPVLSLQHVPLFEPGGDACPYNYLNAAAITTIMRECGICASVSGHYHAGMDCLGGGIRSLAAPAMCETPFGYLVIDVDKDGNLETELGQLRLEMEDLFDTHIHTRFAYCSENMEFQATSELAGLFGLGSFALTEHAGHLYMSRDDYRGGNYFFGGLAALPEIDRMTGYRADLDREMPGSGYLRGLEIELDASGTPAMANGVAEGFDLLLGAVHYLPDVEDIAAAKCEFMRQTAALLAMNVDVLAHPFRIFRRRNLPPPEELFAWLAGELLKNGVAVEMNFHSNDPEPVFFKMCADMGVRIALGSDAHNLCEIGEFYPHLRLLAELGIGSDGLYIPTLGRAYGSS